MRMQYQDEFEMLPEDFPEPPPPPPPPPTDDGTVTINPQIVPEPIDEGGGVDTIVEPVVEPPTPPPVPPAPAPVPEPVSAPVPPPVQPPPITPEGIPATPPGALPPESPVPSLFRPGGSGSPFRTTQFYQGRFMTPEGTYRFGPGVGEDQMLGAGGGPGTDDELLQAIMQAVLGSRRRM
jgi:hypothetical protein